MPRGPRGEIRPADVIGKCRKSQAICIATDLIWFEVCPRFVADSTLEGDWIRSSSTRARKVGCRAPTAAKSNGSTTTLSMRIGDLRSARTLATRQGTRAGSRSRGFACRARPLQLARLVLQSTIFQVVSWLCGRRRRQRCALISPNQRTSPYRCYQPRAPIALCWQH